MVTIGEMQDISKEHEIEWKILYFSSLSCESGSRYESPSFSFANESWCLWMYPNGDRTNFTGHVSIFLIRKSSSRLIKLKCSLGLKSVNGKKDPEYHFTHTFKETENGYGFRKLLSRSKIFERKGDLLPVDVITIFCNLKYPFASETSNDLRNENISLKKKLEVAESSIVAAKQAGDEIERHRAAQQEDMKKLEDSLEKHQAELEHQGKKYEDAQLMLEKTMKEKNDIKKELDAYKSGLEAGLKVIKEDLSDLRNDNISLKKKLEVAEATEQQSASKIEKERAAHKEEMEKLQDSLKKHQAGLGFQCQIM